ncbi:MAG: polyprenyl synthetase family protein [Rhodospirillales bacterium]|jgi:geranylgeranyl pyrophosphate synthase
MSSREPSANILLNHNLADELSFADPSKLSASNGGGGKSEDFSRLRVSINTSLQILESTLYEAACYHFEKPGKQIRGLLALSSGKCLGVDDDLAMQWATAVELLHNASLIHDDICDKDQNRRGQPSIVNKYGEQTALCLGDAIIAIAFQLTSLNSKPQAMLKLFSERMLGAVNGQACERHNVYPNWSNYLMITRGKTSSLLSLPIEGALILSKQSANDAVIKNYFEYAGPIFQITNDIRNFDGTDGAGDVFSDLWDCRPNAIISLFRSYLKNGSIEIFDSWVSDRRLDRKHSDETKLFNYWRQQIIASNARLDILEKLNSLYLESQVIIELFTEALYPIVDEFNFWLTSEVNTVKDKFVRNEITKKL